MANDVTNNPNFPISGDYTTFTSIMDLGLGVASESVGSPYSVYRITSTTNGNVIDPSNLILTNYPVERSMLKVGKPGFEGGKTPVYYHDMLADVSILQVGDILVSTDMDYGVGSTQVTYPTDMFNGMCYVERLALENPIGARLDRQVQILRPALGPDSNNYWDQSLSAAYPVQIINGIAQLGAAGDTPALIPAGFMPISRTKGMQVMQVPDMAPRTQWSCYIPPLPVGDTAPNPANLLIREGDMILTQEGDFYKVQNPYRQDTGIVGYTMIIERYVAYPGGG